MREGNAGEKEDVFRLSQPRGQVTMTSSKAWVLSEDVVIVSDGC